MTLTTGFMATSHLPSIFPSTQASEAASAHVVFAMSAGRVGAFVAAAVGLIGIVSGGWALAHSAGRASSAGRTSMVLGLIAIVLGGLVMATSDGTVGTGNGLGGAIVASVAGVVAMVLGGLARARSRGVA